MTLSDISSQLYSLSVAGYFNGEKFTKNQLNKLLRAMFQDNASQYIGEIALPDGRWWFKVLNLGNGQFDYFIPENKEQNRVLAGELLPTIEPMIEPKSNELEPVGLIGLIPAP